MVRAMASDHFLLGAAFEQPTRAAYRKEAQGFLRWMTESREEVTTFSDLDETLTDYFRRGGWTRSRESREGCLRLRHVSSTS